VDCYVNLHLNVCHFAVPCVWLGFFAVTMRLDLISQYRVRREQHKKLCPFFVVVGTHMKHNFGVWQMEAPVKSRLRCCDLLDRPFPVCYVVTRRDEMQKCVQNLSMSTECCSRVEGHTSVACFCCFAVQQVTRYCRDVRHRSGADAKHCFKTEFHECVNKLDVSTVSGLCLCL
jgi:hypothetical protein